MKILKRVLLVLLVVYPFIIDRILMGPLKYITAYPMMTAHIICFELSLIVVTVLLHKYY